MKPTTGRQILSFLGVFTVLFDLSAEANATHVWNQTIEPHARFHIVWQLASNCMLVFAALALVWTGRTDDVNRIRLAAILLSLEPIGFSFASFTRHSYGGTYFPANVPDYDISVAGIPIALLVFVSLGVAQAAVGVSVQDALGAKAC